MVSAMEMRNAMTSAFANSTQFLNQNKESIKNITGYATFAFGVVELYDIYQILFHDRPLATEKTPSWHNTANKVIIVAAKLSLLLSAGVSRPGVSLISSLVGRVFSTSQLDRTFGPNTIFAKNPRHPRHIVSIAAAILCSPAVLQSTYKTLNWINKKIRNSPTKPGKEPSYFLTDARIRWMNFFNFFTSRPTLHIVNQLMRCILRGC